MVALDSRKSEQNIHLLGEYGRNKNQICQHKRYGKGKSYLTGIRSQSPLWLEQGS